MIELFRFLLGENILSKIPLLALSTIAGISRGAIIALINAAVAVVANEQQIPYALPFGLVLVCYLASLYGARYLSQKLVEDLTVRLRLKLCRMLLSVRAEYLVDRDTGDIYNTLTQEVNRVAGTSLDLIEDLQAALMLVFCIAYMFWLSPLGGLATSVTVTIGASAYFFQDRPASRKIAASRVLEGTFFARVADLLRGFKELRLNSERATDLEQNISSLAERTRRLSLEAERLFTVSFVTSQTFIFLLLGFLVIVLPVMVENSAIVVFQFLTVVLFALSPLERLLGNYPGISRARVSLDRIRLLETELGQAVDPAERIPPQNRFVGFERIRLNRVTAELRDRSPTDGSEAFHLGPVDLEIDRGEVLFISGGNGSGKTTLISILCGLRRPTNGELMVDDETITADNEVEFRNLFAAVFADFHLFNELYGLMTRDQSLLAELLSEYGLRHRTGVEDGVFTTLALSTGQRRRLALCVTLFEDRPVFLFDEFAADQDPHHRAMFYEDLLPRLRSQGKTVIAITHDETRFDLCDRLVRMDTGRIVSIEKGTLGGSFDGSTVG